MKVNLLINNAADVRSGYLNIDPFAQSDDGAGRFKCGLDRLDLLVDPGECEELVAHDVLDAYPAQSVDAVLDHWLSRLAHGGTIALSVVDMREVARAFLAGSLNLEEANKLLHGVGVTKKSTLSVDILSDVLEGKGMKVLVRRVENYRAVVVAQRP